MKCFNCKGTGETEVSNNTIVCCVCKGSGNITECWDKKQDCLHCPIHLYDLNSGEIGCGLDRELDRHYFANRTGHY